MGSAYDDERVAAMDCAYDARGDQASRDVYLFELMVAWSVRREWRRAW